MMVDPYKPKVDDYVKWRNLEGWIYFFDDEYITIEVAVKDKNPEDLLHSPLHRKYHCLVLCYRNHWNELIYVKSR